MTRSLCAPYLTVSNNTPFVITLWYYLHSPFFTWDLTNTTSISSLKLSQITLVKQHSYSSLPLLQCMSIWVHLMEYVFLYVSSSSTYFIHLISHIFDGRYLSSSALQIKLENRD
jgi:hypothetical protein